MTVPTDEQFEQYDAMIDAGADPDVAAYMAGVDECGCVMPGQNCRMCRGAAKVANGLSLAELLSMPSRVIVTALGDEITVAVAPGGHARVVDCAKGLQALVDAGWYNEWSCHIGGRTLARFIAEPVEGKADGPTFTLDPPYSWQVAP